MIGEGARGSPAQIWQWFSPAHLLLFLFFCHGCRAGLGLGPGLFDVLAAGEDRPQNISLPPLWQPCIRLLFLSQGARLLASHCLAGPSGFSYFVLLFQHSASSFFLFLFSLFLYLLLACSFLVSLSRFFLSVSVTFIDLRLHFAFFLCFFVIVYQAVLTGICSKTQLLSLMLCFIYYLLKSKKWAGQSH